MEKNFTTNKVNSLLRCYLIGAVAGRDDALDGLIACCWKAKGNLYAIPQDEKGFFGATREFIIDALDDVLRVSPKLGKTKIAEKADAGGFQYVARQVRNRLRDHVRETYRQNRAKKSQPPVSRAPTKQEITQASQTIRSQGKEIVTALVPDNNYTLVAAVSTWPVGSTKRKRNAEVTAAIAEKLGIAPREARNRKRRLIQGLADSPDPVAVALRTACWYRFLIDGTG